MTIRQQGGVFGRNPTFNDVEADSLTAGTVDINGGTVDGTVIGGAAPAAISGTTGSFNANVGFGAASPDYKVDLASSTVDDATTAVRIRRGGVATDWSRIDNIGGVANYRQYDNTNPITRWLNSTDGTNWTERLRLDKDGNVDLKTGNLVLANGKGIDFSATSGTGTSELFDDYEEGTFVPTVVGSVTAGTGTYTRNVGFYTKIGDRVAFTISIDMTAHTGSGNMRVAGLPFAASGATGDISYFEAAASNLTYSGELKAYVTGGGTEAQFLSMASGTGLAAVVLDTSCELRLTGVYRSA